MDLEIFNRLESEVRGYCRSFPTLFERAQGSVLTDEEGRYYIDFLSGAGSLNYGHNNPILKRRVLEYLQEDGPIHGLDLHTSAKRRFLTAFEEIILKPRGLRYKVQFTGPTGTNAVEAALKLARKVKKRTNIIAFTNGFHGVTLGSVAATGNAHFRKGGGVPLSNTTFMPFCGYFGDRLDTLDYLRRLLEDRSSGVDVPAAIIVETVQGEGGVNVASWEWLRGLQDLCRDFDILLILDDIQVGNGRAGTFFSFEKAGIYPDMVTLSKSLSGYGLPMAVLLLKPELDIWEPGEHNGTFRGNNLAFVTAAEALEYFWKYSEFEDEIAEKARVMEEFLTRIASTHRTKGVSARGRGMIWGLAFPDARVSQSVSRACFQNGLIIETSGSQVHTVVKLLPPLTIEEDLLKTGLEILEKSTASVLGVPAGRLGGRP